jgi:hypothetical protein
MKGLAYSSLRVGKTYWLTNFGEKFEFKILEIVHSKEFLLQDIHTLEQYHMSDLTKFGKGPDFEIRPL